LSHLFSNFVGKLLIPIKAFVINHIQEEGNTLNNSTGEGGPKLLLAVVAGLMLLSIVFAVDVQAKEDPTVTVTIWRIQKVDTIEGLPGEGEADWYYHVAVRDGSNWIWRSSSGVPSQDDDVIVDAQHDFVVSTDQVEIVIMLCEEDFWSGDDYADISSDSAGGVDNTDCSRPDDAPYMGSYRGTWDLAYDSLTGDETIIEQGYYKTSGDYDGSQGTDENDANVYFQVSDNYYPPTASFLTSDVEIEEGESISFDASGSSASPSSEIVTYRWDYDNDGIFDASGISVNQVFDIPGTYFITLKIEDDMGNIATAVDTIIVKEHATTTIGGGGGDPLVWILGILLVLVFISAVVAIAIISRGKKLEGRPPIEPPPPEPPSQQPPSE